ncbi:MAG: IS3 family transposase [Saprospiraceae bacterium]|nr:IS3 family transposase [Saprospiraceae bacterium]
MQLEILCGLFGNSRQAWYKKQKTIFRRAVEEQLIIDMVCDVRKEMPRIGGRKLAKILADNKMIIGRDALFNILARNGLLVRRRRNRIKTTQSYHWLRKYRNLIKGLKLTGPHQLWVSDITYIKTVEEVLYLFLITDAYSKKIIGYRLADTLEARHAIAALKMALKQKPKGIQYLIHHSDRGVQYCCNDYVKLLRKAEIQISMTEDGDPLDNPIAERVNGILKDEWLYEVDNLDSMTARSYIPQIINIYNNKRPHLSIDMLTPHKAHQMQGEIKRRWKNYPQKSNFPVPEKYASKKLLI